MLWYGEVVYDVVLGQIDEFGVVSILYIFGVIGQDEYMVGVQCMDCFFVVGDEDNSVIEVFDSVENLCLVSWIEVICWFIKEQYVG